MGNTLSEEETLRILQEHSNITIPMTAFDNPQFHKELDGALRRAVADEVELIARAIKNYLRWAGQYEGPPQQPSRSLSETWHNDRETRILISLRNVNGELARYKYNPASDRMRKEPTTQDQNTNRYKEVADAK